MARKSGPTILQEELYPPAAPARREPVRDYSARDSDLRDSEIDDARLVDLDVEEQSPFLRGQKRVSARRSSIPKKTANGLLWALVAATIVCAVGLGVAGLYHYGEHSWRFRVESSDNIEVTGMQNVTKAQIMEVMGADIGRNIFFIPLAAQQAQLEQIPWVEAASVMRFVPNRVKVEIKERVPVAFARVGSRMDLIDAGGTLMELSPKHKYSFPVILGMNPGEPLSTRAPRMKAYMEMVRELDGGGARYSQDLSEVDLSDLEDVKVRVNDPAGDVLVHLGSSDYLSRFKIYVTHAQGWRAQFQKLDSVDLRYDNQIIVNPDMEGTRGVKEAPLNPTMAKAAAAAGVKPAALLTRVGAGGKAVPKPAFELTKKTLEMRGEGKAVAGGVTKKVAATPARKASANSSAVKPDNGAGPARKNYSGKVAAAKSAHARAVNATAVKKKSEQVGAMHSAAERQKLPLRRASAGSKPPAGSGGQKPSPGIAKNPDSDVPSD
jgi:cell division protein FtsQ